MLKTLFFFILIFSTQVKAFPQMIRHGYTSCNTCHFSPRGGGALTDYGRALSKELLSTWGYEGEEQWHYGALNKTHPSWLKVGGDFRAVQVHSKDERATIGRFIEMQEQVEWVGVFDNISLSVTTGSDTLKETRPWYVPGFYISAPLFENFQIRMGRFVPRFGINTPEHIFSTRGPLGFGFQSERDTLEMSYFSEKWDLSLSGVTGQLKNGQEASAVYSQFNYSFTTHDKMGISVARKFKDEKAFTVSLHGMVGFTERFYLISESSWRASQRLNGGKQDGFYHFSKLGYELEKGLHFILIEDIKKIDLNVENSSESLYGLGFSFFPRPHFEFQGVLAKRKSLSRSSKEGDYAWLLMHFYL